MDIHIDIVVNPKQSLIKRLCEHMKMSYQAVNPRFFDDPHNILLVAYTEKDRPCGMLYAYALERMETIRPMMMIYAVEVIASYRKRGIGFMLMERLEEIARDMDCSKVFLITNDDNTAAKALYEKEGYGRPTMDDILYSKKLDK